MCTLYGGRTTVNEMDCTRLEEKLFKECADTISTDSLQSLGFTVSYNKVYIPASKPQEFESDFSENLFYTVFNTFPT